MRPTQIFALNAFWKFPKITYYALHILCSSISNTHKNYYMNVLLEYFQTHLLCAWKFLWYEIFTAQQINRIFAIILLWITYYNFSSFLQLKDWSIDGFNQSIIDQNYIADVIPSFCRATLHPSHSRLGTHNLPSLQQGHSIYTYTYNTPGCSYRFIVSYIHCMKAIIIFTAQGNAYLN